VSSKVGGQIWSSVFFFLAKFHYFSTKKLEFFGKFCFSSANSINFAKLNYFFWLNQLPELQYEKNGGEKKTPIWRVVQGNFIFLYSI
jgi:hypothetical protein